MTPEEQIKELRDKINYHSDRYYNQDSPEISDYEFDMLMQQLKKLEKRASGTGDKRFSDTACRRHGKADCRSLSASQCADVKSSGCFLKRRGR